MLKGKKILIGVSGGIAAYKTATVVRLLVREGCEVKVVMTDRAKDFITPLTLATLSRNPVLSSSFSSESGSWNSHIELGMWADLYLIAPATANTISKMANGMADNLLLATYLSARCPVFIAPSMDLDMLNHTAVRKNLKTLGSCGNHILDSPEGELASGLSGKGRMADPEDIVKELKNFFAKKKKPLSGKHVLINAGPTREPIDPVRYISNHSSGKMGIAIADAACEYGAAAVLVLGPVDLRPKNSNVTIVNVTTARSMADECISRFPGSDIAILAAAVADYTPEYFSEKKLKKGPGNLLLRLKPTDDIAAILGKLKTEKQIVAGFALETDNEIENAREKLLNKNLDLIILNSLRDKGSGFGHDTNRITIIDKNNFIDKFELKTKEEAARDILDKIVAMLGNKEL